MSVAQTAELFVRIIGQDLLSPATASAERGLSSMSGMSMTAAKSASGAEKALGLVGSAATGMGNALNHAKGFLGGLISGPLGMIGLGAAAFTLGGALKSGIDEASGMALAIEKLTGVTGMSAEAASQLIAVFGKFGIASDQLSSIAGFTEKTMGKLAETMGKGKDPISKLTALQDLYKVKLTDSKGAALDFATVLNNVSNYYNSNATAGQKAALAATLFGRGFATMIPILKLGSAGIAEAEASANALGLTLNASNVVALQSFQGALRNAGEAVDGLKLQLALDLIPDLTDLANTVTKFTTDHKTDIQAFFKGAIKAGEELGGALVSVGKAVVGVWNSIPGPMRDLMIQALIGNKVIKTVFGIDIIGSVEGAIATIGKNLLGSLVGSLFSKQIATPVVNIAADVVNAGGLGGAGGAAAGAEGAAGGLGNAAQALIGAAAVAAAAVLIINANQGRQDLATSAAAGNPIAQRTQNELATRGLQNPSANTAGGSTDIATALKEQTAVSVNQLSAIKEDTAASIRVGDALLKEQERLRAHAASEASIKDIAGSNHGFLELFRSGNAKSAVKFFPAEYNYLSTASAKTKETAQYTSGLKQDIKALQNAETTATNAQKVKLAADIVTLQNLVKATTAAVTGLNSLGGLLYNPNQNSRPNKDDVIAKVTVKDVNKQTAVKKRYGNDATGGGA